MNLLKEYQTSQQAKDVDDDHRCILKIKRNTFRNEEVNHKLLND